MYMYLTNWSSDGFRDRLSDYLGDSLIGNSLIE